MDNLNNQILLNTIIMNQNLHNLESEKSKEKELCTTIKVDNKDEMWCKKEVKPEMPMGLIIFLVVIFGLIMIPMIRPMFQMLCEVWEDEVFYPLCRLFSRKKVDNVSLDIRDTSLPVFFAKDNATKNVSSDSTSIGF